MIRYLLGWHYDAENTFEEWNIYGKDHPEAILRYELAEEGTKAYAHVVLVHNGEIISVCARDVFLDGDVLNLPWLSAQCSSGPKETKLTTFFETKEQLREHAKTSLLRYSNQFARCLIFDPKIKSQETVSFNKYVPI